MLLRILMCWRRIVCAIRGHNGRQFSSAMLSPDAIRYNSLPLTANDFLVHKYCTRCKSFYSEVVHRIRERERDRPSPTRISIRRFVASVVQRLRQHPQKDKTTGKRKET